MNTSILGTDVLDAFSALDDVRPSGVNPRKDAAEVLEDKDSRDRWIAALTDTYEVAELEHFHRVTGETEEAARPSFFSRVFGSSRRREEDAEMQDDARAYHRLTAEALVKLGETTQE
ncbi:hypothetical protein [Kocuria sp. TGY1127_2]|uniref:hypothetical protein n=1 Tax=Kocuria sp. TGY1127_2 TaxID=2711328 RepID=UPI0015C0941B|nr:hypothetical protein [Kocuria sp. TGY1127_2]